MQTNAPDPGASALAALQSSPTPNMKLVITLLINDLAAQSQARVLILDDYQVIAQGVIHTSFHFLLEHLPANVRVILATRADPPWPLARWCARNQLIELRQADLRFSPAESAEFLQQLRSPRKAQRLFTIEEGADAHCQVNNFPLLHQVVFDWLDDVLP